MRHILGSLCSLNSSSSSTFCFWGVILLSTCINTQLYLPSSKIQPFSGFTFNSLSSFPSAAISHPRCWKPASCSAGFQDLNQNIWHSVHNAGCGFLLLAFFEFPFEVQYVVLWRSLYYAYWRFFTPFPMTFCFALHVSSISISKCGLWIIFRTLLSNLKHWGEKSYLLWLLLLSAKTDLHQSSSLSFQASPF